MTNLLEQQIAADGPGQEVLLDRLLDLVLISAARTWFAENPNRSPRWIKAYEDPVIGHALRLITQSAGTPLDSREPGPGVRQLASGLRAAGSPASWGSDLSAI